MSEISLPDFNLLISTRRGMEKQCSSELWSLLRYLNIPEESIVSSDFPGLILAKVGVDPVEFVERLRKYAEENPWDIRLILKVVPIQRVVATDVEAIAEAASELAEKSIAPNETYRITVRRRGSHIESKTVIDAVASKIRRKVDLTSPDKVVQIEVLGWFTGISVIKPEHVVSIEKIKAEHLPK